MTLLSYPARPVNGGHLKFALPKVGAWSYEPKYNGWRAIVHVPTGAMWNRHGKRLTIEREFASALETLKQTDFDWLDVEALERRHNLGRGSLIVLDCPRIGVADVGGVNSWPYERRVKALYDQIVAPGIGEYLAQILKPTGNAVYIPPVYVEGERDELWQQLQDVNKSFGCDFYEALSPRETTASIQSDSIHPIKPRQLG